MGILEKVFKPKTKAPQQERTKADEIIEAQRVRLEEKEMQRVEEAKQKFILEKPKLEKRLAEIPDEIDNYERGLTELKGPEMRKILDKEFKLNSSLSPIDSTDPNRAREYEMWVRALEDSRRAVQSQKADLGRRMDEYKKKISDWTKEKSDIEYRIQRGY